ncbi:DUF2085 domain-containing protein [Thermomicrobium sp. 4228-Ro]|uniref:DUF2085 domain-containing protein n=1 Tax=Thermomicrobium sp. 4228-Ro TaxID=2993937 RepID=UPI0022493F44|nr:DUF2085 domain-containing protein [Thermomicrobium sp. 4228-Ro]MCX2726511.1 DUF2085 domain-containing protein [Thermomicrobium sp. 4228-Ro]
MQDSRASVVQPGALRHVRFERAVDRLVGIWARHWLATLNLLTGLFAALPLLAPWLVATGHPKLAAPIYFAYRFVCHQRPDRSFFLFGEQVAYCQRDLAIYVGVFVLGLVFVLVRHRLPPLSWRGAVLLALPVALDGTTQLVGLRESTWQLRLFTGTLFALAVVWFVYPRLEVGFAEIRAVLARRERLESERPAVTEEASCRGSCETSASSSA